MALEYTVNRAITPAQFVDVLARSTLAERRPVDDPECIAAMLEHGNLLVCGWDGELLVGVSRCVTDFHFACYLSDLAVDRDYQGRGIGIKLQQLTQGQLGPRCKLILLAAPAAREYYPRIGYSRHDSCWIIDSDAVERLIHLAAKHDRDVAQLRLKRRELLTSARDLRENQVGTAAGP